uniref:Uncharacterized protein n=1 Tax=Sphaerodactylus townsendi TaxID=933632 RepID=A0ACB8E9F0_9SAUR
MSDGGSEAGSRALLPEDPAAPQERARAKESRAALGGPKLRAGGATAGFKELAAGTSASSPGSSQECAPDTDSQVGAGEADYCRRILVRGKRRGCPPPAATPWAPSPPPPTALSRPPQPLSPGCFFPLHTWDTASLPLPRSRRFRTTPSLTPSQGPLTSASIHLSRLPPRAPELAGPTH